MKTPKLAIRILSILIGLVIMLPSCKKDQSVKTAALFEADINGQHWTADKVFAYRQPENAPDDDPNLCYQIIAKNNDGSSISLTTRAGTFSYLSINDYDSISTMNDTLRVVFGLSEQANLLVAVKVRFDLPLTNSICYQWSIINEQDIKYYEIEGSNDGIIFKKLATVNAKNSGSQVYSFYNIPTFINSLGNTSYYYRLKIIMNDGSFSYSVTSMITMGTNPLYIFGNQNVAMGYNGHVALKSINQNKTLIGGSFNFTFLNENNHQIKVANGTFQNVVTK